MPIGVTGYAVPVGVMPAFLARAFRRTQAYTIRKNDYPGGENQRALVSQTSRKAWELHGALSAIQLTTLRSFYTSHHGPLIPFEFIDPYQNNVAYTVRFDGPWNQQIVRGRIGGSVQVRLIQLASGLVWGEATTTWALETRTWEQFVS
jgi:hypothetical protein